MFELRSDCVAVKTQARTLKEPQSVCDSDSLALRELIRSSGKAAYANLSGHAERRPYRPKGCRLPVITGGSTALKDRRRMLVSQQSLLGLLMLFNQVGFSVGEIHRVKNFDGEGI